MHLPTGDYRVLLLWGRFAHINSKHWVIEFVMSETGERGSAFVFASDIGKISAAANMLIGGGRLAPRDPDAERPVLTLSLKYDRRFGNTRATGAVKTDKTMACDIRIYGQHFEPQEF